jgi:hypothetical protein
VGWTTGVQVLVDLGKGNVQTALGIHPASYSLDTGGGGDFPRGYSGRGMKLTTHLCLMPKLRMRGAMSPLQKTHLYGVVRPRAYYMFLISKNLPLAFFLFCSRRLLQSPILVKRFDGYNVYDSF